MHDESQSMMRPDPRLGGFARLLAIGILAHSYLWPSGQMTHPEGVLGYPERWAWTPGLFLPVPLHLALNWGVFGLTAVSLAWVLRAASSAVARSAAASTLNSGR